jgi:hypothetical protein
MKGTETGYERRANLIGEKCTFLHPFFLKVRRTKGKTSENRISKISWSENTF